MDKEEPWKIRFNKVLNKKIAIKNIHGFIILNGIRKDLDKNSVMIDDNKKTIFTPSEWKSFNETPEKNLYLVKKVFDGFLLT